MVARRERTWTSVILVTVMLVQMNGLLHHGFMGQDWGILPGAAAEAIRQPPPRWIVYITTNPPGLFWLCALIQFVTGTTQYLAATGFVLVGLNLIALGIWARLGRAVIRRPSLRLATLLTLAFLPVRVIHSTVFASDALVVLPFTLTIWLFSELFRAVEPRR